MKKLNLILVYIFRLHYKKRIVGYKSVSIALIFFCLLCILLFIGSLVPFILGKGSISDLTQSNFPLVLLGPIVGLPFIIYANWIAKKKFTYEQIRKTIEPYKDKGKSISNRVLIISLACFIGTLVLGIIPKLK